jgi:phosphotransferase system  glucose/maltose/N-acetylglucosamine-specific IIC component
MVFFVVTSFTAYHSPCLFPTSVSLVLFVTIAITHAAITRFTCTKATIKRTAMTPRDEKEHPVEGRYTLKKQIKGA